MKTEGYLKVTEVSVDEIADFLETATLGHIDICYDYDEDEHFKELEKRGMIVNEMYSCDRAAVMLHSGGTIKLVDIESEGEHYWKLPYKVNSDNDTEYFITIKDFKEGIERALNGTYFLTSLDEKNSVMDAARNVINGEYDSYDAFLVLQIIMFNEIIYG